MSLLEFLACFSLTMVLCWICYRLSTTGLELSRVSWLPCTPLLVKIWAKSCQKAAFLDFNIWIDEKLMSFSLVLVIYSNPENCWWSIIEGLERWKSRFLQHHSQQHRSSQGNILANWKCILVGFREYDSLTNFSRFHRLSERFCHLLTGNWLECPSVFLQWMSQLLTSLSGFRRLQPMMRLSRPSSEHWLLPCLLFISKHTCFLV